MGSSLSLADVVRYTNYLDLSDATMIKYAEVEAHGKEEAFRRHMRNSCLFFLKSSDWEGEQEFRWVVLGRDDQALYVPFGEALAAVIEGVDFHLSYRPPLRGLWDGPLFRMRWENGRPSCDPVRS